MNQATQDHQKLVDSLIYVFKERGYTILPTEKVGRHVPDIMARTREGLIVIGEAKILGDVDSERSKEQYWDFSNRQMAEGPLKGQSVPFHIIVYYKNDLENLRRVLYELGLGNKIGKNIFLWYFKE